MPQTPALRAGASVKQPPVIDISHWIHVPDFSALDPLPWLIITKATEGTSFLDATYAEYADGIRDAGIRLGAYHFMAPGDEIKQADWFCEILLTVGLRGDELLACDMEVSGISLEQIKRFIDRVEARTGIRPILYSSQLRLEGLYPGAVCPEWLKGEWLWIAEYPASPDSTNQIPVWIVPRGCSVNRIALWQYTDDGVLGGIPGNNVDLNLINPTFAQAIGLTEPIFGGIPMPEQYFELTSTVTSEYRVIRKSPSKASIEIGRMQAGWKARAGVTSQDVFVFSADAFEGTNKIAEKGDIWRRVFENNGRPIDGWMAEIHLGKRYLNVTMVGSTPPPPPPDEAQPLKISIGGDGYQVLSVVQNGNVVDIELKPTS